MRHFNLTTTRLRRATAIESGLFKIQANHLLQFRQRRRDSEERQRLTDDMHPNAGANGHGDELAVVAESGSGRTSPVADTYDALTHCFVRMSNLPTSPLDRLSRYEATLWRQARQIMFTLQRLGAARHRKDRVYGDLA
jgi:hypothetical protein